LLFRLLNVSTSYTPPARNSLIRRLPLGAQITPVEKLGFFRRQPDFQAWRPVDQPAQSADPVLNPKQDGRDAL
jgi:hypothetical protein